MADVRIDFGFDDLAGANKFLQEMKKVSADIRKNIQASGKTLSTDAQNAKNIATATRKVAAEKKKLTAIEKEQLRIERALETTNAKIALATSKEARLLAQKQKQLRSINTQLRTGGKNTNAWGKALGSFQFKFNALGNIAANVVGQLSRQITQFVKGSLEAYDKQIKAERSLLTALNNRKGATDRLIQQAKQLQKITLFGDEETIRAQSLIAAFVDEEAAIKKIIPLVQDMAQAKGMDLAGAADLVAKTLGSSTNAMSRYGITVEGAVGSTERLDTLTRGLNDAFGGQAKAAALVDSQFTQLKNSIGDLQESIGEFISDEILFFRLQHNLFPDMAENLIEVSEAELKAQEKFKEFTDSVKGKDSKAAIELLNQYRETQSELNGEIKNAVSLAAEEAKKRKGNFTEANKLVETKKQEKVIYNELIPLVENYISSLEKSETQAVKKAEEAQKKLNDELIKTLEILRLESDMFSEDDEWYWDIGIQKSKEYSQAVKDAFDYAKEESDNATKQQIQDQEDLAARKRQVIDDSFALASQTVTAFTDLFAQQKERELSAAGDNAEKRLEIEKKYLKKEQALAISQVLVDTAASIIATYRSYGGFTPAAIIASAAMAGLGAVQVATIKNQKFAKGGWIGGEPHSRGGTNIEAERGEFVIRKASATKYSDLIEAINQDDQMRIMDAMSRDKKITINAMSNDYNRKIYELMQSQERYGEDSEYYIIHKGNKTTKIRK